MVSSVVLDYLLLSSKPFDPYFPEALVRGGFGFSLKKTVCMFPEAAGCSGCILRKECLFSIMYDPGKNEFSGINVSPYTMNCTLMPRSMVMNLRITLFDKALSHAGTLTQVLSSCGKTGIGKENIQFDLLSVKDVHHRSRELLSGENLSSSPRKKEWNLTSTESGSDTRCTIDFLSPAKLLHQGAIISEPSFADIVRSCVSRFLNLERSISGSASAEQGKILISSAENVSVVSSALNWSTKNRFSTSQKRKVSVGGIIGRCVFEGEISIFVPILEFGAHAGIGKNTTFGNGRFAYRLE